MRGRAKNFIKTKKSKNKEKVRKLISFQEQDDFTPEFQLDYGKTCVEFTKFIKGFDFMWEDGWFKRNYGKIKRFSLSDESILLIGETGTGKEVISRLIHFQSKRKEKAFHPLNCSSLNNELLYCELFGHEKGAFTSADRKREGILKSSDGGTVFLDEIQSSSRSFQQVLLRFLDYGEIKPLGSDKIERVDIRIITACCTSPEELLSEGKLLKPFYYRISKLNLYIPPLREREEDLEKYIYYFLLKECRRHKVKEKEISPEAMEALKHYPWPGNLRELKAVIKSIVLLVERENIEIDELPEEIKNPERSLSFSEKSFHSFSASERDIFTEIISQAKEKEEELKLDNVIRKHIQEVLELTEGNKSRASKLLGIPLTTLINKMKKLGIK